MFLGKQQPEHINYYKRTLQSIGSLSRLFSDSPTPYLYYRVAENLFCKSFCANNLSRSDVAIDATWQTVGIGLKTFLRTSTTKLEKIAEFNTHSASLRRLSPEEQVLEVSRLRNERLVASQAIYNLDTLLYHCVVREKGRMSFVESPMRVIDFKTLRITEVSDKVLRFHDEKEYYSFNLSKSTLFKRFSVDDPIDSVSVGILDDPFKILEDLLVRENALELVLRPVDKQKDYVVLPLYSTRSGVHTDREVPQKSGLNQWNAAGRPRDLGEVYIPIPALIHKSFPNFFPTRDEVFSLTLPNNSMLQAKVCQDGSKALMTNPNIALGQWILRDVLRLAEGELLTYKKLADIGLDSVVVYKLAEGQYRIDFAKIGMFEEFVHELE